MFTRRSQIKDMVRYCIQMTILPIDFIRGIRFHLSRETIYWESISQHPGLATSMYHQTVCGCCLTWFATRWPSITACLNCASSSIDRVVSSRVCSHMCFVVVVQPRNTLFALCMHSLYSRSWEPFLDFYKIMFRFTKANSEIIRHYLALSRHD